MKKEQKYPTEVAEILDIEKEQYDKIKDNDKELNKLKQVSKDNVLANALKESKKSKAKDNDTTKSKHKMKMTQRQ